MSDEKKRLLRDLVASAKDMVERIEKELEGGYVSEDYIREKAEYARIAVGAILDRVKGE